MSDLKFTVISILWMFGLTFLAWVPAIFPKFWMNILNYKIGG